MPTMTSADWALSKYFTPNEFKYPSQMDTRLIRLLNDMRGFAGMPFHISDDYRVPEQNPGVGDSAHLRGLAVDITANCGATRFKIVQAALTYGVRRIGVYDHHVHIDIDQSLPQDVIWVGQSK